jgi:hypothetical protein
MSKEPMTIRLEDIDMDRTPCDLFVYKNGEIIFILVIRQDYIGVSVDSDHRNLVRLYEVIKHDQTS